MTSEIPVTQAREELADLLNRVAYGHERIVLTRHSRPVACIVPPEDLAKLEDQERADGQEQGAREDDAREEGDRPEAGVSYIGLTASGDATAPGQSLAAGFPGSGNAPGSMPIAARHQEPPRS
jgi:prevent-host-death family protein